MTNTERPRLLPAFPFPKYSYVPGHFPHPLHDPAGHSFGIVHREAADLRYAPWHSDETYCHGIDLFNHGYYWEAHEAWESSWHAASRRGATADLLKGLIKLAAAGVKAREGNPNGVFRHAVRARELFESAWKDIPEDSRQLGLARSELISLCENLASEPNQYAQPQLELLLPAVVVPR